MAARAGGQAPWTSVAGVLGWARPRCVCPTRALLWGCPSPTPCSGAVTYPPAKPPGLAQLARGPGAGSSSFVSTNEAQWSPGWARCRGHFLPTDMPAPVTFSERPAINREEIAVSRGPWALILDASSGLSDCGLGPER